MSEYGNMFPSALSPQDYMVWYDNALGEILIIEKQHYNDKLHAQLLKEHIEPVVISSASRQEAQEEFMLKYETLHTTTTSLLDSNSGARLLQ